MTVIVTLMGIDGSGKSSLGRLVCQKLVDRGEKTEFVWASLRPVLLKPFIKAAKYLLVRKHDKFRDYAAHMSVKRAGMKKLGWTHGLYFVVMMIDYLPQVMYKVALPRLLGRNVVCDRYYHDLMLDYCAQTNSSLGRLEKLIGFSQRIFPRPDLVYLVDVSPEVALSRKDDIPALEYLQDRIESYSTILAATGGQLLDGTKPLEDNANLILQHIDKLGR